MWCGSTGYLNGATQRAERRFPVEQLDVFGLGSGEPPHRPGEMDKVGFVWGDQWVHAAFVREQVALPVLQELQAVTTLAHSLSPPRESGIR